MGREIEVPGELKSETMYLDAIRAFGAGFCSDSIENVRTISRLYDKLFGMRPISQDDAYSILERLGNNILIINFEAKKLGVASMNEVTEFFVGRLPSEFSDWIMFTQSANYGVLLSHDDCWWSIMRKTQIVL